MRKKGVHAVKEEEHTQKRCTACGMPLSVYNKGVQCFSHGPVSATYRVRVLSKQKGAPQALTPEFAGQVAATLEAVSEVCEVTLDDLFGSSRADRKVVWARHIAMYFLRKEFGRSFAEIVRALGRGGVPGVYQACKRVEREIKKSGWLRETIRDIREEIRGEVHNRPEPHQV